MPQVRRGFGLYGQGGKGGKLPIPKDFLLGFKISEPHWSLNVAPRQRRGKSKKPPRNPKAAQTILIANPETTLIRASLCTNPP